MGILLIIKSSKDILRLLGITDQIKSTEDKVAQLEKEEKGLVEKKEYYQSDEFVEQEARNKLNMARPGETVVVLPPKKEESKENLENVVTQLPNWGKWWKLFFE